MEKLSLAYNRIHDIRGFSRDVFQPKVILILHFDKHSDNLNEGVKYQLKVPKLKSLDMKDNQISDLGQLHHLDGCKV